MSFLKRFYRAVPLFFLVACQAVAAPEALTATDVPTITASPTTAFTATPTLKPSTTATYLPTETATTRPTATATATPMPTATPNWNPPLETRTPAPAAVCPATNPQVSIKANDFLDVPILEFLNAGGVAGNLEDALAAQKIYANVTIADVTGDAVPETLVSVGSLYIFGCVNGEQKMLLEIQADADPLFPPYVIAIHDLNADGVAEVVFANDVGRQDVVSSIQVLEWDGQVFHNLVTRKEMVSQYIEVISRDRYIEVMNGGVTISDTDSNGTFELVTYGGIRNDLDAFDLQRSGSVIWMWNGEAFVLAKETVDAPKYRFQAVDDGDHASLNADYDAALGFYQQAIFDINLLSWSDAQRFFDPSVEDDPKEWPRFEAYSRYRIMLLHAVRGYKPEAQTVYDTLQKKFPMGKDGHSYAELATVFWSEYIVNGDIAKSCAKAITYAKQNTVNILRPLESPYYTTLDRDYAPEDMCPFK